MRESCAITKLRFGVQPFEDDPKGNEKASGRKGERKSTEGLSFNELIENRLVDNKAANWIQ